MFDTYSTQINSILSITIGGVSLATILGLIIAFVIEVRKLHKQNKLTKKSIEEAFQNVILPSNIKLDLSKKIEEPLKAGFTDMKNLISNVLEHVAKGEKLILSVLNEFSHVRKLPDDIQEEIKNYITESKSITVLLEG